MHLIGRYIFRMTFGAFAITLVSLTSVIWIAYILRDLDVITNNGRSVMSFISTTSLFIPMLVLIIAPMAFLISAAHALHKLNSDSEIIALGAAGVSPSRIFVPFFKVALLLALFLAVLSTYLSPKCLRQLRFLMTEMRADLVASVLTPGRFMSIDRGLLTFNVRERTTGGTLLGLFIDDRRDPNERTTVIAEAGTLSRTEEGTYLILQNGTIQRQKREQPDPVIVSFGSYGFDLSGYSSKAHEQSLNLSERSLLELLNPPADLYGESPGRLQAEIADRIVAPVYPLVFMIILFACIGTPQTTRQGRGIGLTVCIVCLAAVRLFAFAAIMGMRKNPMLLPVLGTVLAAVCIGGLLIIRGGFNIDWSAMMASLRSMWPQGPRTATQRASAG